MSFYDELDRKFGASGDFAQAYVLAHEVGHHVQNLIGVLPKFNAMRQNMGEAEANAMSVRVELQADCFAGIWGHFTKQKGILDAGDLEEALNAAQQIGDDNLQRRMQGYVVPESFNHGTSAQRATWFKRGFDSGKLESCDTFQRAIFEPRLSSALPQREIRRLWRAISFDQTASCSLMKSMPSACATAALEWIVVESNTGRATLSSVRDRQISVQPRMTQSAPASLPR